MAGADAFIPSTYRRLPLLDFSHDLIEPAADALAVLAVPPCGWSDLGTPERVRRCLARRPAALAADRAPSPATPLAPHAARCVLARRLAPP